MRPMFVYRSGGLLPVEEISNPDSVWFDGLSAEFLNPDLFGLHEPRSSSVYASLDEDDAWSWAERRVIKGEDATIYSIRIDDPDMLRMYRISDYDAAVYAHQLRAMTWASDKEHHVQMHVDAYWNSSVSVAEFDSFLMASTPDDAELDYSGWEVKVPASVAAYAEWEVEYSHDFVTAYWAGCGVTPHMFDEMLRESVD